MRGARPPITMGRRSTFVDFHPDPAAVVSVAAWVVALLFGKHLQAGYAEWRKARLAEQPIRRDR
jgi:hypothetical protein